MKQNEEKAQLPENKRGAIDIILSLMRAGASFHPAVGAVVSLITDYIPNQRQDRLEGFVKQVASDLEKFKDSVNDEYIKTNEFAFIFERCLKGTLENYQQEKIQAFRAVLINSLTSTSANQNEKEFFLALIDRLSVVHMRILYFMADPHQYLDARSIPRTNVEGGFSQFFPRVMPDISLDHIKIAFQELYTLGFTDTDKGIFGTMTSTSGYALLTGRLTETGRAFMRFISIA